jgi:hypothetical protein
MSRIAFRTACYALGLPIALAFVSVASRAQTGHTTPAPILAVEWGERADSVIHRVSGAGWTFVTVDEDSDYVFRGEVNGVEAVAFASFSKDRLTTLQVNLAPHPGAARTYAQVLDTLASVNGPALISSSTSHEYHPAYLLREAAAWPGILAGFRRDGWITIVFTCPESSPRLPAPLVKQARV